MDSGGQTAFGTAFVATGPSMVEIRDLLLRLSDAPSNVLLSGESGTGKDLAAHALHYWGARAEHPLVSVDLPAIPADLTESELFGYEAGAFTGARRAKPGKIERAGEGTLFLDHIGDIPTELQAKLLRVVEDRRFERLGGTQAMDVRARFVASASADVTEAVERGIFRRDLFHRLGVFWIRLPPLRERVEDIRPLAQLFLSREQERLSRAPDRFTDDALCALENYFWPGNVRELRAAIERGALLAGAQRLGASHLPEHILESPSVAWGKGQQRPRLVDVEKDYIRRILEEVGGNQTRAAAILGISRKALWEKRRRFDLD